MPSRFGRREIGPFPTVSASIRQAALKKTTIPGVDPGFGQYEDYFAALAERAERPELGREAVEEARALADKQTAALQRAQEAGRKYVQMYQEQDNELSKYMSYKAEVEHTQLMERMEDAKQEALADLRLRGIRDESIRNSVAEGVESQFEQDSQRLYSRHIREVMQFSPELRTEVLRAQEKATQARLQQTAQQFQMQHLPVDEAIRTEQIESDLTRRYGDLALGFQRLKRGYAEDLKGLRQKAQLSQADRAAQLENLMKGSRLQYRGLQQDVNEAQKSAQAAVQAAAPPPIPKTKYGVRPGTVPR